LNAVELPNRRVEAWKYSDLRAALAETPPVLRDGRDIIERLAPGTQRMTIPAGDHRVIVERMSDDRHLDARSFDFALDEGASLTRIVIQTGGAIPLAMARVKLAAGAKLKQFVLATGGKLARIETHVDVAGEGAEVELNGVYLARDGRHADLTSVITHNAVGGVTRQLIKGVAAKGGRGVFQGKIVVAPGAQRTDARQYHHGMLLEAGAEVFAKPELMIHADDVQCAHGNTAGGLDEAALFYLRSRGVPDQTARSMLIEAFLVGAIPEGLPAEITDELTAIIAGWLESGA
jgi:Fe-S cluster assembly protein SufD